MKNTLETRLGIFFALALVVAVVILEMIGSADIFKRGYLVTARFKNAQELKKGDLVKMAGVEVGRVEKIELDGGRAKITMNIKGYEIKTDARAVIKFTGLMGQNFVAVEGGTDTAAKVLPADPPPNLESTEQPDLSVLMAKLENVATGIEGLTKSFSAESFSTLLGPLTDFIKQNSANISTIFSNTAIVTANVASGKGTVGKLINDDVLYTEALGAVGALRTAGTQVKTLVADAQGVMSEARAVLDGINKGRGTLGQLATNETLYVETTEFMRNLRDITSKMNKGQGTVGKLINDDSFYKNAKLSLQKLDKATEGLEDQGPLSVLGIAVNSLF